MAKRPCNIHATLRKKKGPLTERKLGLHGEDGNRRQREVTQNQQLKTWGLQAQETEVPGNRRESGYQLRNHLSLSSFFMSGIRR
jgi:hypothetical protein